MTDEPEIEEGAEGFNAGSAPAVQRRSAKLKRQRRTADSNLAGVMSTRAGRAVLWAVLARSGLFRISHTPGGTHADCAFHEGKRNVGLPLFNDLMRVCPDSYALAAREAQEDDNG